MLEGMLLLTRCQSMSPHSRYLTEKKRTGQPEVSQDVMSSVAVVTLISFSSMLCGGMIGAGHTERQMHDWSWTQRHA